MNSFYVAVLLNLPGIGRKSVQKLLCRPEAFPQVSNLLEFYAFVTKQLSAKITMEQLQKAYAKTESITQNMARHGIQWLSPLDVNFPIQLRDIPDSPVILYAKGNVDLLSDTNTIALIGTRSVTGFGQAMGREVAKKFASFGIIIVSGLALGCDAVAHRGCLEVGGKTVAILAHGLDMVYPSAHRALADQILSKGGCLLSEYPPGTKVMPYQLVERDRLQSGLSRGVVVIETGLRGGTMHTVGFANNQNRAIACLSPNKNVVISETSGNKELIKKGAFPLTAIEDVRIFIEKIGLLVKPLEPEALVEEYESPALSNSDAQGLFKPKSVFINPVSQKIRVKQNHLQALDKRIKKLKVEGSPGKGESLIASEITELQNKYRLSEQELKFLEAEILDKKPSVQTLGDKRKAANNNEPNPFFIDFNNKKAKTQRYNEEKDNPRDSGSRRQFVQYGSREEASYSNKYAIAKEEYTQIQQACTLRKLTQQRDILQTRMADSHSSREKETYEMVLARIAGLEAASFVIELRGEINPRDEEAPSNSSHAAVAYPLSRKTVIGDKVEKDSSENTFVPQKRFY